METQNLTNDTIQAYLFRKDRLASHPVGSIFMSTGLDDPGKIFGGKWAMVNGSFQIATGKTCRVWERTS